MFGTLCYTLVYTTYHCVWEYIILSRYTVYKMFPEVPSKKNAETMKAQVVLSLKLILGE